MPPANSAHKMMDVGTYQYQRLSKGQLTNAAVQVFPASGTLKNRAVLRKAVLTNVTGAAVTATVRIVQSGGSSASNTTDLISAMSIPAQASGPVYHDFGKDGIVLEAGDAIFALAGANTSINLLLSGGVEHSA